MRIPLVACVQELLPLRSGALLAGLHFLIGVAEDALMPANVA
jgi:hypothetical protein